MADIRDYGFISDCHSGALVSREGSVDWLCLPRFDSPSVFARLLDPQGGHWSLRPEGHAQVERDYDEDSLVLTTTFVTPTGRAAMIDAMLFAAGARRHDIGLRSPHVLVREVRVECGEVVFDCEATPRPEYGVARPALRQVDERTVEAVAGAVTLTFSASVPLYADEGAAAVTARFRVGEGESVTFAMAYNPTFPLAAGRVEGPQEARAERNSTDGYAGRIRDTTEAWRSWAADHWGEGFGYDGPYRDEVRRSALVLQGLTYQTSGAVIAALTTSLPERESDGWNWDYRYAWLRDASFVMRALWIAACPTEPELFFRWLAVAAGGGDGSEVQIVYGVEGERDLAERALPLAGFNGSGPVRVGNLAWTQRQLDVVGEVLDAAHQLDAKLEAWSGQTAGMLRRFADFAAARWRDPDSGMWEARDKPRHYTSSKIMCWLALDRALKLADRIGADERERQRWERERGRVHACVTEDAWVEEKATFGGALGSDHLDASVLLIPLVGFLPADDPRVRSTIRAVDGELGCGPLVRRWSAEPNGFLLTSFWMVQCLALLGEVDEARQRFEALCGYGNDLGLLAEEGSADGEAFGNVPQVFSHVGLINAAWEIAEAERRAREGVESGTSADNREREPAHAGAGS